MLGEGCKASGAALSQKRMPADRGDKAPVSQACPMYMVIGARAEADFVGPDNSTAFFTVEHDLL